MPSLKFRIYILLFLCTASFRLQAYVGLPALIHLDIKAQHDTVGFNLVKYLPTLIYEQLEAGTITLWNDPTKEVAIPFSSLQALEKSSKTSFIDMQDIFLNELWSRKGKKVQFFILGLTFTNKSSNGNQVAYGYVDTKEAFSVLNERFIPVNINGSYKTTYWDALRSRRYEFNLLQLGKKNHSNLKYLLKQKKKAFNEKTTILDWQPLPHRKLVRYEVPFRETNSEGKNFIKILETFLKENPEVFYNHGGFRWHKHTDPDSSRPIRITEIVIDEIWNKKGSIINHTPLALTIYLNDRPLEPFTIAEISSFDLVLQFKTLEEFIKDQNFTFTLMEINGQEIYTNEAIPYLKGLRTHDWNQLTEFVKYY